MIAKILIWLLATLFPTTVSPADAQNPAKVPRIGVMVTAERGLEELRQGLRERGYVEGKNIELVHRYIQGNTDRMPSLVAELLEHKVDVLILSSPTAIRAAKNATRTIPIVMITNQDPVAIGLVESLARPGGNLTGVVEGSNFVEEGGLISYAANDAERFRRAALYVDKILKGAKPAELPVEQAMKFEFVINLKTAKQIGLTIPPNVLARADKVIR